MAQELYDRESIKINPEKTVTQEKPYELYKDPHQNESLFQNTLISSR